MRRGGGVEGLISGRQVARNLTERGKLGPLIFGT
jgi:hypothetical protein